MSNDPNAVFNITPEQARQVFDAYELSGEQNKKVSVGQRLAVTIPVTGHDEAEDLQLSVLFLPPSAQAGLQGYTFGLVAKHRTADDRRAFEDLAIATAIQRAGEITFRVFLDQPQNQNVVIPTISFELTRSDGNRIKPITQPHSYIVGDRDIIGAVALAQNGQPVTFPLFSGSTPNLTAEMKAMTLIVAVDEQKTSLEFALK